jgi:hypothetical protein
MLVFCPTAACGCWSLATIGIGCRRSFRLVGAALGFKAKPTNEVSKSSPKSSHLMLEKVLVFYV